MFVLQELVFPCGIGSYKDDMFCRGGLCDGRRLLFFKNKFVRFDTFYNALQIRLWKSDCGIDNLRFYIKGSGKGIVKFGVQRIAKNTIWLGSSTVELSEAGVGIAVPGWAELFNGLLFVEFAPLEDGYITEGAFLTETKPVNNVRLGLVITHFNRQNYVINAVKKIDNGILHDDRFSNVSLVIVDNSQNLNIEEDNVVVIKNRNTGGSGGFARGLMYLKDSGFTHCLFMDDDASCLPESIKRTYAFFSYYIGKEKIGLSGTLLRLDAANIVHESGAVWTKNTVSPIGHGRNVSIVEDLLALEWVYKQGDYGAWCYFAFEINSITSWPYPFFVRGDDVLFSLQNKFRILKILGVATCIDSFPNKDGPMTFYLSYRADLIISSFMESCGWLSLWKRYRLLNSDLTRNFLYSWAYATQMALDDLLRGNYPSRDVDGSKFRSKLSKIPKLDSKNYYDGTASLILPIPDSPKSIHGILRRILWWKYLFVPERKLGKRKWCMKREWWTAKNTFGRKEFAYYNDDDDSVIVAKFDKKELLKGIVRNISSFFKFALSYPVVKRKIREDVLLSTKEEFWRDVFS